MERRSRTWGSILAPVVSPRRDLLPIVVAGLVTAGVHLRWLALDGRLAAGDAAGHLMNVARYHRWLDGGREPVEAFPPALYVLGAWTTRAFGPTVDAATGATVLFAVLLAVALAWLGNRVGGWVGGLLLPALALSQPLLAGASRQLLLDLPMTAIVVCTWCAAWASAGFSRPVPTLLVGVFLGLGALVKYTLFPWVLPALLLAGVSMLVRSPASILPLLLLVPALHPVGRLLLARASASPMAASPSPQAELVGLAVAGALAAGVWGAAAYRWRDRPESRWRIGLMSGACLALSALIAVAAVLPWFVKAMPLVWEKVHREAVAEVRVSPEIGAFVTALVLRSWPGTWWLLQAAVALEAAWLGWLGWAKLRGRALDDASVPGPAVAIALSCALGTWATTRGLPADARYYLPLLAGVGIVVGLGLLRFRVGRWLLAPAAGVVAVAQLVAAEGAAPVTRVPLAALSSRTLLASPALSFFAPEAPRPGALGLALAAAITRLRTLSPECPPSVLLAVPPEHEARGLGFEPRGLGALAWLQGARDCAYLEWSGGPPPARGAESRLLFVAGVSQEALPRHLGEVSVGDPLSHVLVERRVVAIYPLAP